MKISVEDALRLGVELHQRGMLEEAASIYDDVLRTVPDQPDALHFSGVLAHQRGDREKALRQIERSLAVAPDQPGALNNLGNINQELGRLEAAEAAYRRALTLVPQHADTWVNLAVIHRNLRKLDAALAALERALELAPEHAEAHHNLGNTYRDLKRMEEALAAYSRAAELSPEHDEAPKAIAKLHYDSGRVAEAVATLERLLAKRPGDAVARHQLAAYTGRHVPPRASDEFVRQTFDRFAATFDTVLAGLDYRAPRLVGARVAELLGAPCRDRRMLDAGCGTGLCAPLLRPYASELTGIDLSAGMLERARQRALYDELAEAELTAFMSAAAGTYDVVVSVDTFVYFGDLAEVARAAANALAPGGWLIFTVERHADGLDDHGFRLEPHGRYSHTRSYIESTLAGAGLPLQGIDDVVLRTERQEPVDGLLAVARKP